MTNTDSANAGRPGTPPAPCLCALPQLIDPANYAPCDWDLLADDAGRAHWLNLFNAHFAAIRLAGLVSGYREHDLDAAWKEITAVIERLRVNPRAAGDELNILTLDRIRDGALRRHGVPDPFAAVKQAANEAAMRQLADRLEEIDRTPEDHRLEELARGMFAGNLFDMGAPQTAARFHDNPQIHFDELLQGVKPRPWLIDGVDRANIIARRKAVIFVDNAGGDVVLGVLPLTRALLLQDAQVILAASQEPVLNDVTAEELTALRTQAEAIDSTFADERLQVISTGTDTPLIDLTTLNPALCNAAVGCDLLILVGMGRALESNWMAEFTCESWRVATIKEHGIAKRRGGEIYDCVFRVEQAGRKR